MDTEESSLSPVACHPKKLARPEPTGSPPPNCAICLGTCANKCFTDCCLHQFCFKCLLEWSKIKAECPLCKQPFKSIIYNIKSNSEYEEHVITNPNHEVPDDDLLMDPDDPFNNLFLPNGPRPQRHFQFRTTLTVEPGGELAIQQLLLSHPLTNSLFLPSSRYNRIPQQTIPFRRAVYQNGWWVSASPDLTGRYRDCSPNFFRENPAQTHRITPWLNRELSALISDYVDIFVLQEVIMEMLCQYPITSSSFRTRIVGYLGNKTDHFIHEFFNFVRSPFDMIGYDRNIRYNQQRPMEDVPIHSLSDDDDDDSDVRVIDSPNDCIFIEPGPTEVIVIDDSDESDVIIREPTPPVVVDLLDTDSDPPCPTPQLSTNNEVLDPERSPKLPIKLRLKLRKQTPPCRRRKGKRSKRKYTNSSDSDSVHPRSDSDTRMSESSDSNSDEDSVNSGSDWTPVKSEFRYTKPLILKRKKVKKESDSKSSRNKKKYNIKRFVLKCKSRNRRDSSDADSSSEKNYRVKKSKKSSRKKSKRRESEYKIKKSRSKRVKTDVVSDSMESDFSQPTTVNISIEQNNHCSYVCKSEPLRSDEDITPPTLEQEEMDNSRDSDHNVDIAGPSYSTNGSLRSVIVKGNNMWFSRPDLAEASTDNNSD